MENFVSAISVRRKICSLCSFRREKTCRPMNKSNNVGFDNTKVRDGEENDAVATEKANLSLSSMVGVHASLRL